MFGKRFFLLFGLLLSIGSQIEAATTVNFALKGDIGGTQPEGPERVDIGWYSRSGALNYHLRNTSMATSWTNYTLTIPDDSESISIKFLNDKVLRSGNVNLDWNVRLDTNYFLINGTKTNNMNRQITGSFVNQLVDSNNLNALNAVTSGVFAWGVEYVIVLPIPKPSTEDCDDPSVDNIICFHLKGIVGDSVPFQAERVKISYDADDGNRYVVHHDYILSQDWERIMIKPPVDVVAGLVIVQFLNDKVWTVGTIEYDRNVRLNLTSFEVNHKAVKNMRPYISGPIYDKYSASGDHMRLGNIMSGNFAWGGEYYLSIPEDKNIEVQSNGCTGESAYVNAENPREVCFNLKGFATSANQFTPEFIKITYFASEDNVEYTLLDTYPISSKWETFKITSPGYQISSVLVTLLNENDFVGANRTTYGIDVDLNSFRVNGINMNNTTPCFNTAPMKDGKLLLNFE